MRKDLNTNSLSLIRQRTVEKFTRRIDEAIDTIQSDRLYAKYEKYRDKLATKNRTLWIPEFRVLVHSPLLDAVEESRVSRQAIKTVCEKIYIKST